MKYLSSRWIDLKIYKTKEILFSVVTEHGVIITPANKAETFYKCICPFHKEKTASMKFYLNKSYGGWSYKCFGCGKSGDVFTFLMQYNNWEFWDAMVYVVKKKNIFTYQLGPLNILNPTWIQLEIPFPKFYEESVVERKVLIYKSGEKNSSDIPAIKLEFPLQFMRRYEEDDLDLPF